MTETEKKLSQEIQILRGELANLRTENADLRGRLLTIERIFFIKGKPLASGGERVFAREIAAKFNVCVQTVRNMQGEFADLHAIHQRTETGRYYWIRRDYDEFLRDKNLSVSERERKRKGLIRKNRLPKRK